MTTWNLDQAHTVIGFKIKHLVVSTVRGSFTDFEGTLEAVDDTFENAAVRFTAQAASINTNNEMRDGHLKSAELFDTDQFPTISFVSTSFVKKGDAFEMHGDLTIKGITQPVTLSAVSEGIGTDMQGRRVVGFAITGVIKRDDFGLTWNKALETGGFVLGDDVTIDIQAEALAE